MTDEIRDADGCEDYESLEESGLHEDETAEQAPDEDICGDETDDGEPDIVEEPDAADQALQAANDKYMRLCAVAKTVLELLPAVDSFERAMESPCTDDAYRNGMEKIYQQMTGILQKLGIEEISAMNEPFDPKVHNAIRQIEDENFGESTVCEVYQKGYRLGDRIIRCAMVSVAN